MRHKSKKVTLDRKSAPRAALLRHLAESVILYEQVKTTAAKARAVRPLVEQIITRSKEPSLHARRELYKILYTRNAVNKCLEVLGPRYVTRPGGYTRTLKLPPRRGDGASMVILELVKEQV